MDIYTFSSIVAVIFLISIAIVIFLLSDDHDKAALITFIAGKMCIRDSNNIKRCYK